MRTYTYITYDCYPYRYYRHDEKAERNFLFIIIIILFLNRSRSPRWCFRSIRDRRKWHRRSSPVFYARSPAKREKSMSTTAKSYDMYGIFCAIHRIPIYIYAYILWPWDLSSCRGFFSASRSNRCSYCNK